MEAEEKRKKKATRSLWHICVGGRLDRDLRKKERRKDKKKIDNMKQVCG